MEIDIDKIAKLAKLKISKEEHDKVYHKLYSVIEMVENLPKLDMEEETLKPLNAMKLRKDEVRPSFSRDALLENAPEQQAGCIVVPKIRES